MKQKPLPQSQPTPSSAPAQPAFFNNDAAPFLVFDGAHAFGNCNDLLQLELYANTLVPMAGRANDVRTKPLVVGHLRGTAMALAQLRAAIDRALELGKPAPK